MRSRGASLAVSCLLVLVAVGATEASGQSLADVARASSAQKKAPPKRAKVYTNDDLRPDITPSPAAPAPGADASSAVSTPTDSASTAPPSASESAPAAGGVRDEKHWRERMATARQALDHAETFASALQSQINGLTADFVNRDDPAQRALIEQRRTKAVADLDKAQRDIAAGKKAIAAVEEEARKAGVPAGWLR